MTDSALYVPLASGDLLLEPMKEAHREGLRVACAQDDVIWQIYPTCWVGDAFDPQFDATLNGAPRRRIYAILLEGKVSGMTGWIEQGAPGWSIEIGGSFIAPALRGTGLNTRIKHKMIDHAFACGLARVGFKVDARNARSRAAVLKLGAVEEGVLRHERQTWNGHVRDTVSFSILRDEWSARKA
jgi:RimJ/RimL family protein N-acetyltransferase